MRKRGVDGFRVLQSEEKEKYQTIMLQITLDMYQTLAAAVVVLALGRFLRGRVRCWSGSASRLRSSAACCSPFLPAYAMERALQSSPLMIF